MRMDPTNHGETFSRMWPRWVIETLLENSSSKVAFSYRSDLILICVAKISNFVFRLT
jgi:hypothetical protein